MRYPKSPLFIAEVKESIVPTFTMASAERDAQMSAKEAKGETVNDKIKSALKNAGK